MIKNSDNSVGINLLVCYLGKVLHLRRGSHFKDAEALVRWQIASL